MLDEQQSPDLYFEKTLEKVEESDVLDEWNVTVRTTNIPEPFIGRFLLLLRDPDLLKVFLPKNEEWKDKQYETVKRLIQLDRVVGDNH